VDILPILTVNKTEDWRLRTKNPGRKTQERRPN